MSRLLHKPALRWIVLVVVLPIGVLLVSATLARQGPHPRADASVRLATIRGV